MVASSYFECITARSFCAQILLKPKPHFFATVMDQINWIGKYVQSRSTYSHGNQKWKRNSRKFATVSVSRFLTMTVCTKFQEQVNPKIFNYRYSLHLLLFLRLRRIWFQIPITFCAFVPTYVDTKSISNCWKKVSCLTILLVAKSLCKYFGLFIKYPKSIEVEQGELIVCEWLFQFWPKNLQVYIQ